MHETTMRGRGKRRLSLAAAAAAAVLLAGCSGPGATAPSPTPGETTPAADTPEVGQYKEAMKWAFPQLRGRDHLLTLPDHPGAFPFPSGIPTPQGKPVVMAEADGAWAPMYETKTPDKTAETLASEMKKVATLVESGTYSQDDGSWDRKFFFWVFDDPKVKHTADMAEHKYWHFVNDEYAIQIEMTGTPKQGEEPPPGVGIVVVDRAKAKAGTEFATVLYPTWENLSTNGVGTDRPSQMPPGFPSDIPVPKGELGYSWHDDKSWGLIIELDNPQAVAEKWAAQIGAKIPLVQKRFVTIKDAQPPKRTYWDFLNKEYAVQIEWADDAGTPAPPAVGVTVVRR